MGRGLVLVLAPLMAVGSTRLMLTEPQLALGLAELSQVFFFLAPPMAAASARLARAARQLALGLAELSQTASPFRS